MAHWAKLRWTSALNHTCRWVVGHQQFTKKNFHFCYVRSIHPWAINWWKLVSLCRAEKLKGWGDVLTLVAKRAAGFVASCWIFLSFSLSLTRGWTQVLVVSHLDASSMLHLASASTQMAALLSANIEWLNLLDKIKLDRQGAFLATFFQNKESSIESWKFWELCNFKVKVWPSWPTSWKLSTTQIPFSFQFSALSVDNIQLMMARPKGLS